MAGASYPASFLDANNVLTRWGGNIAFTSATNQPSAAANSQGITSGALPTVTLSSGTAAQVSTTGWATLYVVLTADATNNAATGAIALSADNSTFTTVGTVSLAAAVNNTGAIVEVVPVVVPQGWYVKVTVAHMTIGATGACVYA
jgi:hypothetical protein